MSEVDEDGIKKWSLSYSDLLSAKLKTNIGFKDFESQEVVYSEHIESENEPQWIVLCEDAETQQPLVITLNYTSIMAMTNVFFSSSPTVAELSPNGLSFTERFLAEQISDDVIFAFESNEFNMKLVRMESDLSLIRPFHDDESITIFKFNCVINSEIFGALKVCHSHVL